jgi:hypothetical protein
MARMTGSIAPTGNAGEYDLDGCTECDPHTRVTEGLSISDEDVLEGLGYTIAAGNGDGLFSGVNAPVGVTPSVNAVAEPASVSLLVAGVGLLGLKHRRARGLSPG